MDHSGRTDRHGKHTRSEGGVIAGRHLGSLALSTALALVPLALPSNPIAPVTPAYAGTCNGPAGGPYTVPAQNDSVNLVTECGGGVAGQVTVTGDVTGSGTAHLIRDERTGQHQPWTIIVNQGVTVEDAVNANTDAMNFRVRGVTVDNAGTIDAPTNGSTGVNFQRGGTVINRATGTIRARGNGVFSTGGDFTLTNETGGQIRRVSVNSAANLLIENAGTITGGIDSAIIISSSGSDIIRNSGTIVATDANRFAVYYNSGSGAAAILENSGTITGGANQRAIEFNNLGNNAGNVTNSGTITGGALGAIRFAGADDRLELQPGSMITGLVNARGGTDTLAFGGAGAMTFDMSLIDGNNTNDGEQYRNFETFLKEDGSTWTLTGTNTEITNFAVNGGVLAVNGAMGSTAFAVAAGGTLGGGGTVGDVLTNGVIAPGNSIGTINVAGSVTFNAGSRYDVEIAANGASDLINATGTANLGGNGQVNPVLADPVANYMNGQTYTIVTAAGGVNGQFAGVTDNSALLDYALTYDPNNVYLNLSLVQPVNNAPNFPLFATNFNQTQLATALLGFDFAPEPDLLAQLLGLNATQLAGAYDAMTGEVYASGLAMAAGAGSQFTNLLMANAFGGDIRTGRASFALGTPVEAPVTGLMAAEAGLPAGAYPADGMGLDDAAALGGDPWLTAWAGGYGASVDVDGDGNAAPWNATVWGFGTGLEADLSARLGSNTAIGAGFGYGRTDGGVNARNQALDIESWQFGLYGRTGATPLEEGFALRGAASAAYQRYDATRTITIGGIARQARASYDGGLVSGAIEARYQMPFGLDLGPVSGTAVIAPLLRAQASHVWTGGFTETGAGALNLTAGAQSHTDASVSAGVALGGAFRAGDLAVKPSFTVAWDRLIGGGTPSASLSLAGSPTAFSVRGPAESPDRLRLGTVTEIGLDSRVSLNFATDTLLSADRTEFSAKASLKIAF
ncbi:MAG: autotransporter domain-containing protein [Roseitalea sp.]|nr:autotransporter domain-containing protein [Roseitalea sp.]MBO6953781.1 autotransporter domain-containing protein [Rhizobiaceae bacterium]MBO6594129.1 autotransporter domain-containing protein [Roseitalea sp.]MBO6601438.1 autotransporter domain-containing protein [Roseitalea sp.]MBO6613528.1 autotransporter domain-containing protein [Roseitalea sp.]